MQKKFITNLAFLLFLNLLIKPFWLLGIDRSVQNAVGAEEYGHYYALFNFSFLFNILLDFGITNFNSRNIAQNRHLLEKHLSGIIILRILLAGLYFIISCTTAAIIGYDFNQFQMLLVLLLNQLLISFILYLRSNLAGLHMFRVDSIISVLDRAIMIAICSFLLWGRGSFKIEWFIWSQTFAYVITIIFTFLMLNGRAQFTRLSWNPAFSLLILKKSYPFAVLILLMTFYNRIDSVMLERLLDNGAREAGIYAQAYRLLDASNMIAYLFAGLLLPMFAHMLKNKQEITQLLRLAYSLLAVPAITVAMVCILFRVEIMDLLYTSHVSDSSTVFAILMSCFFAISNTYIYGTLLTANGNLRQLNIMAAAGMIINVILNLILIPHFHATGAAISSMITQFLTAFSQVIICYRIFRLKPDGAIIFKFLGFASVSLLICLVLKESSMPWKISLLASFTACILIAFIFKLISIKSLVHIIKNET